MKTNGIIINVVYERGGQPYTFFTYDESIKVNDFVVVPNHKGVGYAVCLVVGFGKEKHLKDTINYKWITQKLNLDKGD